MYVVMYGKWKAGYGVKKLCDALNIQCVLMDDKDKNDVSLQSVDYIVVTPGISPQHSIYKKYQSKILSELSFIALLQRENILPLSFSCIGVTGTNGKSTTSFILYQAAKSLLSDTYDVYLAGNTDNSFSTTIAYLLDKSLSRPILFVLEVSSFMLYNLQNFIFDIGIFINISQDHLDWHGTMEAYWESKYNIISHAKMGIVWQSLVNNISLNKNIVVSNSMSISNPHLLGEHNQENLSIAYTTLKIFMRKHKISYTDKSLKKILSGFVWMPHRLEKKLVAGIVFIDDAISTSEHSLMTALRSLDDDAILIVGWYDNGEKYEQLSWLLSHISQAIVYWSNKYIFSVIFEKHNIKCRVVSTLKDAIQEAFVLAKKQDCSIVYSPGSKSFDQFTNVYHRIETLDSLLLSMPDYLQHQ